MQHTLPAHLLLLLQSSVSLRSWRSCSTRCRPIFFFCSLPSLRSWRSCSARCRPIFFCSLPSLLGVGGCAAHVAGPSSSSSAVFRLLGVGGRAAHVAGHLLLLLQSAVSLRSWRSCSTRCRPSSSSSAVCRLS